MSLLSEYDIEQGIVAIELLVPCEIVLLSSYYAWNEFMDRAIERKRLPTSTRRGRWMFAEPLLKHDIDDIQAVIPWIDPKWICEIKELSLAGRADDESLW